MTTALLPSSCSKRSNLESATYSLAEFAALLGISYSSAHLAAQAGTLPVKPLGGTGRQYRFPKAMVHRLLGIESAHRFDATDSSSGMPA
jgi:hypothetical protein